MKENYLQQEFILRNFFRKKKLIITHYSIIKALDYKSIKNQINFHRMEMHDQSLISVIFIRFIALSYLGARLCFETKTFF